MFRRMLVHHEEGAGPPLLLLHGIGSRWQVWKPVIPALAKERRVIAVDLPGFGATPPLAETPTPAALARAVASFMDDKGIAKAHLAGNSMGGWIALELAALQRALSVTAISPAGFWTPGELRYSRATLKLGRVAGRLLGRPARRLLRTRAGRRVLLSQSFWRGEHLTPDEALEALDGFVHAPAFDGALRAMTDEYTFRRDADVRCKVTFAFGEHDRLTLPRQLQRAHARFPGSRALLLKGCGHVPFWDATAEVTTVMLQGSSSVAWNPPQA